MLIKTQTITPTKCFSEIMFYLSYLLLFLSFHSISKSTIASRRHFSKITNWIMEFGISIIVTSTILWLSRDDEPVVSSGLECTAKTTP